MITPRLTENNKPLWKEPLYLYPSSKTLSFSGRIIVEIGPGRGDFLFYLAGKEPEADIYGIEIKEKRFRKLIKRRDARGLDNISLIKSDARDALSELFKKESVDSIFILFPDPWPKRRHGHYRLFDTDFARSCLEVLKLEGELNFVTDDKNYAESTASVLSQIKEFRSQYNPSISTSAPDAFETFFARKWKMLGRTIYYQKYVKK